MALYEVEPELGTLVGSFSRDYPPILTIESGDTVRYRYSFLPGNKRSPLPAGS